MTDKQSEPTALDHVAGAATAVALGIPPQVATSFWKSIGRLVGGAAAYPAAWLRRATQNVEDTTTNRSTFREVVTKAAAERASTNPDFLDQFTRSLGYEPPAATQSANHDLTAETDAPRQLPVPDLATRAVSSLSAELVRKQVNKERVAEFTGEDLASREHENAPIPDGEPDDDWMNIFVRYAEDASSERMQRLWGRVLAGEIRKPGAFSPRTMRFVAELDQRDAEDFEKLAGSVFSDAAIADEEWQSQEGLARSFRLESAGLVTRDLTKSFEIPSGGKAIQLGSEYALVIEGQAGMKFSYPILLLSPLARQLLPLVPAPNEVAIVKRLAAVLQKKPQHSRFLLGRIQNNRERVNYIEVLYDNPAPPN